MKYSFQLTWHEVSRHLSPLPLPHRIHNYLCWRTT